MNEIRLSRSFTCAFYDAMVEGKIEVPEELLESLVHLSNFMMNK